MSLIMLTGVRRHNETGKAICSRGEKEIKKGPHLQVE